MSRQNRGNPNPTPTFKANLNSRAVNDIFPEEPLAKKPLTIRVYEFVYNAIAQLPKDEKAAILREVLSNFAINKLGAISNTVTATESDISFDDLLKIREERILHFEKNNYELKDIANQLKNIVSINDITIELEAKIRTLENVIKRQEVEIEYLKTQK